MSPTQHKEAWVCAVATNAIGSYRSIIDIDTISRAALRADISQPQEIWSIIRYLYKHKVSGFDIFIHDLPQAEELIDSIVDDMEGEFDRHGVKTDLIEEIELPWLDADIDEPGIIYYRHTYSVDLKDALEHHRIS